jgi:hypothetical protein
MRALIAAALLLFVRTSGAGATDVMITGPLFGSGQSVAVCYVINEGTSSVVLSAVDIYYTDAQNSTFVLVPTISDTCGTTLDVGRTCRTVSNIGTDHYYLCRTLVSSKARIRGTFELRAGNTPVVSQTLR